MQKKVSIVLHPLVQHKLTLLRSIDTTTDNFRRLVREIAAMLTYEATRDLATEMVQIKTPVADCESPLLSGKKLCLVSILRAGNGMVDGVIDLLPGARVGHIGLYRDPETLEPVEYYYKMPDDIENRDVLIVDPMLATGNSVIAAITRLKNQGVTRIRLICILAAQEGIDKLTAAHPDVELTVAAVDEKLNDHGYIVPGLGDAGDRIFGTK